MNILNKLTKSHWRSLTTLVIATTIYTAMIMSMVLASGNAFAKQNAASSSDQQKKVLMVVSGYGENQGQDKPGYEFDEFSKAYAVFKANNIAVDIASPKGGAVVADKYDPEKSYNVSVLADKAIIDRKSVV